MVSLHLVFSDIRPGKREFFAACPVNVLFGLIWCSKNYLLRKSRKWPVLLASVAHMTVNIVFLAASILCSICVPTELMQHRVYLCTFFTSLLGNSLAFYVPWPIFLSCTCSIHLCGWYVFHGLVGYVTVPCMAYGPCVIAGTMYIVHLQNQSLWQAFDSNETLLKERQLLQKTQESLHGVLSSIFDASCTCDSSGRILECSSQLQEILDCSPMEQMRTSPGLQTGLNLCAPAASDAERHRLTAFLNNANASARQQAAKIQSCFNCRLGGVIEVCLYAIVLPAPASGDEPDVLFVALQTQSMELDTSKKIGEPDMRVPEQTVPLPCSDQLQRHLQKAVSSMDDVAAFASLVDNFDMGTVDSLSLSASIADNLDLNVETQTVPGAGVCTADAEVQTIGSAAKPPRPASASHGQRSGGIRLARGHRRAATAAHRLAFPEFKRTPRHIMQGVINAHILARINPMCSPCCCTHHMLLAFLRHEVASMQRSDSCRNWDQDSTVQCSECFCLQLRDDEEPYECEICFGTQVLASDAVHEENSSGVAGT